MAATHVTFRVYLQVDVVWLYQGEKLRNKTLACTMFMPLQRVFLAALMALIPVKESFCTTCSGRYVAHFTAKIMFARFISPDGHIFICSSKYDSFRIFAWLALQFS